MAGTAPALLAAAAGVAFGHAVLPDHWVPLAVLGRARRYPMAKLARLSGLAGIAHVLLSVVLGVVIIVIGLQFRGTIERAQDTIIGCLLIATGVGFMIFELTGHGHSHSHRPRRASPQPRGTRRPDGHDGRGHDGHDGHAHDHDHAELPHERRGPRGLAAVMVPFGAAASPDLTILPVFLAATTVGVATAVGALLIFAVVTIATIVTLTLVAAKGGYQIQGQWLEQWGNAFTALVLVAIGVLVLAGVI